MKKAVNGIQYLKLHGCIDHYMDRDIPFILNSEQYARYFKNRTRMLDRFRDWGTEFPIIFCGYSMSDPHIQSILFDLFDMQQQRQMYYVVDPEIDPIEERYLASHRITPIRTTLKEFLVLLDAAISTISRSLPKSIGGGTSTLRRHYKVANAPESDALFHFCPMTLNIYAEVSLSPRSIRKTFIADWTMAGEALARISMYRGLLRIH
jgi:SIR2-like domain